jgi:hypothetical protein
MHNPVEQDIHLGLIPVRHRSLTENARATRVIETPMPAFTPIDKPFMFVHSNHFSALLALVDGC